MSASGAGPIAGAVDVGAEAGEAEDPVGHLAPQQSQHATRAAVHDGCAGEVALTVVLVRDADDEVRRAVAVDVPGVGDRGAEERAYLRRAHGAYQGARGTGEEPGDAHAVEQLRVAGSAHQDLVCAVAVAVAHEVHGIAEMLVRGQAVEGVEHGAVGARVEAHAARIGALMSGGKIGNGSKGLAQLASVPELGP